MNKKAAEKLLKDLEDMRRNKRNISQTDMVKFAKRCGRKREKIGDEPTYYNTYLPDEVSISIPGHKTDALSPRVAGIILDRLETDLFLLIEQLEKEG